jgi:Zn-finger nucleic acid-binding protein
MKLIACQECKRQWDVTRYRVGEKLRCVCNFVMQVPRVRSYTPEVHHCQNCGASHPPDRSACQYCGTVPSPDSVKLSLVCPLCLRRTPKRSKFCACCGEPLNPGKLDAKTGKMPCPRCLKPRLVNRKIGDFMVDECPACSGMWVDASAFDGIVRQQAERGKKVYRREQDGRRPLRSKLEQTQTKVVYLKCPVCKKFMHRRNFMRASGVIIDECRGDGVWLDCDELGKIGDYISSGGLRHSQEILQQEAEQTRRINMEPTSPYAPMPSGHGGTFSTEGTTLGSVISVIINDLLK